MDSILLSGRVAVFPSSVVFILPAIESALNLAAALLLALSPDYSRNTSRERVCKTGNRGTMRQIGETTRTDLDWPIDTQHVGGNQIRGSSFLVGEGELFAPVEVYGIPSIRQ